MGLFLYAFISGLTLAAGITAVMAAGHFIHPGTIIVTLPLAVALFCVVLNKTVEWALD